MESINFDRKGEILYDLQDWVQKVFNQSKCEYWKRVFTKFTNEFESSQSSIWLMMVSDEFSMISVKSGLMIERLNHTITTPKGSFFHSTRLPLHTARCHYWIVGLIGHHLDNRWSLKDEIIPTHQKEFRWYCDENHNISYYQIEWNL